MSIQPLQDHHNLVETMLRSTLAKGKPKTIFYRRYKNLDNKQFEEKLKRVTICDKF